MNANLVSLYRPLITLPVDWMPLLLMFQISISYTDASHCMHAFSLVLTTSFISVRFPISLFLSYVCPSPFCPVLRLIEQSFFLSKRLSRSSIQIEKAIHDHLSSSFHICVFPIYPSRSAYITTSDIDSFSICVFIGLYSRAKRRMQYP